jgi:putative photosynthetic complex assembly protein 2
MNDVAIPIAFALLCWWLGTGLVFLAERALRARRGAAPWVIAAGGALAMAGIAVSSTMTASSGAYLGFACSIGLWGALELSFLTGLVIGPRRRSCEAGCRGWRHFGHAVMALLYHELALAACGVAVIAICWNQANTSAAWVYGVLWIMRESAKLNLFLGVRNPAVELLPARLAHLAGYFGRRRANALLPVSVAAGSLGTLLLVQQSSAASASDQDHVAALLLATLLGLAVIEHLVLILPVRADALWTWATRRNGGPPSDGGLSLRLRAEPDAVTALVAVTTACEGEAPEPNLPPGAPA